MDGRGRWMDNVFIERLWRSLKHEDIYLRAYADGREARAGIAAWVAFYNTERFHQALGNRTPMLVWREGTVAAAASGVGAVEMMDNAAALTTSPTAAADNSLFGCIRERLTSGRSPISRPAAVVLPVGSTSAAAYAPPTSDNDRLNFDRVGTGTDPPERTSRVNRSTTH